MYGMVRSGFHYEEGRNKRFTARGLTELSRSVFAYKDEESGTRAAIAAIFDDHIIVGHRTAAYKCLKILKNVKSRMKLKNKSKRIYDLCRSILIFFLPEQSFYFWFLSSYQTAQKEQELKQANSLAKM